VAGLDSRGLLLEAPLLRREGCVIEECPSGGALLRTLDQGGIQLVVLGPLLDDMKLPEVVARIRDSRERRNVSILCLVPSSEPAVLDEEAFEAGANALLRRPLDRPLLEAWIAKLLTVARRVEVRIPVDGQVVGSPRQVEGGHFYGLARNLSAHGLLLACPVRLSLDQDVEIDLRLSEVPVPLKVLGRIVRSAGDVRWPYLGYGVEFLYVPAPSMGVIDEIVRTGATRLGMPKQGGIHSTLRRGSWIYEILHPAPCEDGWQVEIRRAPLDQWRAGRGGPFFVVAAPSPTEALLRAREFLGRHA
jgi:CheY-like chemotaxis protein